jgi:hypothetical protein
MNLNLPYLQLRELTGDGLEHQFDHLGDGMRVYSVSAGIRGVSWREGRVEWGIKADTAARLKSGRFF